MNALQQLHDFGQSYWLDNLTRELIRGGELARRVEEDGLRGVTSNPSIFNKAITKGEEYDADIERLVRDGLSVLEVYDRLTVRDIRDACDVLRPVYDESGGVDGYVSLEVSPYLAHDTRGSLEEARRLFGLVERPNVFIKIPGTDAGVPAIEEALYEGININITLLFGIDAYEAVAGAYVRALERRLADGRSVDDVASVASFFLSRIDVLTDALLGPRIVPGEATADCAAPERLLGEAAIANAKLAYRSFLDLLETDRWKALEAAGARPQRMLWASTSTKDPLYSDVRYVEPLIGPHTINTLPDETIAAFADHGVVADTVTDDIDHAREVMDRLAAAGIDFDRVTAQLIDEGVQKFIAPFDKLMATLAERRDTILGGCLASLSIDAGELADDWAATLASLDARQFGRRLWARDAFLWGDDPAAHESITNRLGWLDAPAAFRERADEITTFAAAARDDGFTHVVLLGMGGSSLCPEVCARTFGAADGWPELIVLDDTDPDAVRAVEERIDVAKTLFLAASKSGTTVETLSFYRHFLALVTDAVGDDEAAGRFVAITDPDTPLAGVAQEKGFRACFTNPADIGGRYSALSYFGLVPMALLGIDIDALLVRAAAMARSCAGEVPAHRNPGSALGALLGLGARRGRDKVTFVLSPALDPFGMWAEQLLAESTGKDGVGVVPIDAEPLAAPRAEANAAAETAWSDRVFVHMRLEGEGEGEQEQEQERFLDDRVEEGHPVVRIALDGLLELGAEFLRWEVATAVAGSVLGVNPFDEPNVAESKRNTQELLDARRKDGSFGEDAAAAAPGGTPGQAAGGADLAAFLDGAAAGDYVALLPWFHATPERGEAVAALRRAVLARTGVATTVGWGPRYLHSTGQLHKGGPDSGLFVLLTADPEAERAIPGAGYDFGTLHRAQALGDLRSLTDHGRRVLRLHLDGDVAGEVTRLADTLAGAAGDGGDGAGVARKGRSAATVS